MSALQMRSARDDLVSSKAVVRSSRCRSPAAARCSPCTARARRSSSTARAGGRGGGARREASSRRRVAALSRAARLEDGGFRDALRAEDAGVEEAKAEPPRLLSGGAAFERAARRRGGAARHRRRGRGLAEVAGRAALRGGPRRRGPRGRRAVPSVGGEAAAAAGLLAARPWPDYARVRRWRVGAADVLSGSDALVDRRFDADTAVRLIRAEDVGERGSRRRAVLDGWLENVIAGVPKLALCLERFGVVVGAKVLDTAEIPKAFADADGGDHALFDAKSVEVHAAAVLRFLADHCDRDGATYALADAKKKQWKWLLATLSARFAHRVRAHLRLGADGGAGGDLDAATRSSLLGRLRGLATTALDLLAEIEDSEGEPHLAMRASLEEMKAASFLDGAKSWRGSQRAADHPRCAPARARTSSARDRFEAALAFALRLASEKKSEFGKAAISRRVEDLSAAAVDCAVALAAAHLERVQPSNLMHELRRAATGLRGGGGGDAARGARAAAVWHLAAAFARGVDKRRFEWSERGAHAPDCVALLKDLDDVFHQRRPRPSVAGGARADLRGSDLGGAAPGCFHAPDALALAAGLAAAAAADAALVKPRFSDAATCGRGQGAAAVAVGRRAAAAAPRLLPRARARARGRGRAAPRRRRAGGPRETPATRNDVGGAASKAGHEAGDGALGARARAWLAVALARVAGDEAAEARATRRAAARSRRSTRQRSRAPRSGPASAAGVAELGAEDALDDADAPDLAARVRGALPPAARDLVAAVSRGGGDDLAAAARARCKAAYLALMKGDAAAARRELAPLWDAG
ncbi:hypothetical protein JL721_6908 [Aureococcus anophagefferens]|nr:hypothetical protein JL721_6908 [Aureococcus anophagefferens]